MTNLVKYTKNFNGLRKNNFVTTIHCYDVSWLKRASLVFKTFKLEYRDVLVPLARTPVIRLCLKLRTALFEKVLVLMKESTVIYVSVACLVMSLFMLIIVNRGKITRFVNNNKKSWREQISVIRFGHKKLLFSLATLCNIRRNSCVQCERDICILF